jgi:hypothetical protein
MRSKWWESNIRGGGDRDDGGLSNIVRGEFELGFWGGDCFEEEGLLMRLKRYSS